jgi:anti-sigma factor ChrR (cupin superfamily)
MLLRADFALRERVLPGDEPWRASPAPGVERRMLDRIGDEVARATSIVRYAPNSSFPRHVHGGGEEFLVLDGLFGDELGEYPAGTYVRNPIGTAHAPFAGPAGATLFVKLQQFDPADVARVVVDTRSGSWSPGEIEGLSILRLHEFESEYVGLVLWDPDTAIPTQLCLGGSEILVLEGVLHDEHGVYPSSSWLRNPPGSRHTPFTRSEGALLYMKTGHLGSR